MLHGETHVRGVDPHQSQTPIQSQFHVRGRFGRLFPGLPAFAPDNPVIQDKLMDLGAAGGPMDGVTVELNPDNPRIPAIFTFLGQFLDHDLTFDPTSSLERQNDPEALENFRTPSLELDHVYGSGPRASRHLYNVDDPDKFLVEKLDGPDSQDDLPRNSQNTAILGDPRNDENVIVSQLHVAFLKFHNEIVDQLRRDGIDGSQVFTQAQRMVRWHYQWIIVNEFLPLLCGESVVRDVLRLHPRDRIFQWRNEPFIPVEFSVAAYRFGHSQVRPFYRVNSGFSSGFFGPTAEPPLDDPNDLRGGKRAARRFVEWENFITIPGQPPTAPRVQLSKKIDTRLSSPLFVMPPGAPGTLGAADAGTTKNPVSLAQRNLLRSLAFSLPSGQAMAQRVGVRVLGSDVFADLRDIHPGFDRATPPWFYILREASTLHNGERLGPLGARIVAEVFIGVLQGDRFSFLNANPNWRPELGNAQGEFSLLDLLTFAKAKLTA